jgi:NTE family protein
MVHAWHRRSIRSGNGQPAAPMITTLVAVSEGLVLAGGGTKAAFEVGALRYLSRNGDYAPSVIAGTSAGSMIAATLAQGHGGAETAELARVVLSNVLAVTDMNVVFSKQTWLQELDGTPFAAVVDEILATGSRPQLPDDVDDEERTPAAGAARKRILTAMSTAIGHAPTMIRASRSFRNESNALLSMDPLGASLRGERHAGIAAVDEARVADSGTKLRLTLAALGDGVARYVTEHGEVVEADSTTPRASAGLPGVVEGVLASSSVPMVFPPRPIGDDVYCDGGVVQNAPLAAAVQAGAGDVTALLASPIYKPRDDVDYANASLMAIYSRAVAGVAQLEATRANLRYPLAPGARLRVIAPTVEVVGTFEVAPGLIDIAVDYGWLRAAETLADLPASDAAELAAHSDTIAVQRAMAWQLEERVLVEGTSDELEHRLAEVRRRVIAAAAEWERSGLEGPEGWSGLGTTWEVHRDQIPEYLASVGMP